jgi:hypothetical protein
MREAGLGGGMDLGLPGPGWSVTGSRRAMQSIRVLAVLAVICSGPALIDLTEGVGKS